MNNIMSTIFITDAGVESGLTLARAKELYTKKYKELTPK